MRWPSVRVVVWVDLSSHGHYEGCTCAGGSAGLQVRGGGQPWGLQTGQHLDHPPENPYRRQDCIPSACRSKSPQGHRPLTGRGPSCLAQLAKPSGFPVSPRVDGVTNPHSHVGERSPAGMLMAGLVPESLKHCPSLEFPESCARNLRSKMCSPCASLLLVSNESEHRTECICG